MDSFYEQPRKLSGPQPSKISSDKLNLPYNSIPDASMLLQNVGNRPNKQEMTYNAWRMQFRGMANYPNILPANKENLQPSILRKQVRFESPNTGNVVFPSRNPTFNARPAILPPALINHPKPAFNKVLQDKPFEKIYMANIPNRHLDLSVIEPPRSNNFIGNQQKETVSTSKDCFQVTKRPMAESTTIDRHKEANNAEEPSVKDLLKIIQQQNEQLMNLQKQVTSLLEEKMERENETRKNAPEHKNKHLEPKFAIDVMTSFEVSIRGPPNKFGRRFQNEEARITEISSAPSFESQKTPSNNDKGPTDLSLTLSGPIQVMENCPSPENSVHVDMKDYSSDEDDEGNDVNTSQVGWTIYNNVMDQVNCLLKKNSEPDNAMRKQQGGEKKLAGTVMKQVRDATLKHLRKIGVDLRNYDDHSISSNNEYTPTQISFAVKQLLMKYLPDDQLTKTCLQTKEDYPKNVINPRPDFSLASLQYMKKYNLLANDGVKLPKNYNGRQQSDNRMLDITALKSQPKLL